uniref:Uncharacterized protein n=1 Tax=viral metagenome TaxID=1070528 RepID=A0A6C0K2V4_9ZZZZ
MHFPTIVTAFYNIRAFENGSPKDNRQMDQYLQIAENFIMTLPYPLMFFIDPDDHILYEFITQKRQKYADKTFIYQERFQDTYFFKDLDRIRELQQQYPIYNGDLKHETPLYVVLNNNKFHFIEKAIESNHFQSSHFIWMDLGINHVARNTERIHEWILRVPDKIKQLCINPFVEDVENREIFHNIYHHMAGGLFSGNAQYLKKYADAFKTKTAQIYNDGWWQVDEAVMTMVQRENPDWFDLFYGDYIGIISNYSSPIHSLYLIFTGLSKCMQYNKTAFAQNILNYLEKYFEKEEHQSGEFANAYIRQSIIANYYQNNQLLKTVVLQIINKNLLKENQEVIQIIRENAGNLQFYGNRNMIIS